MLNFGGFVLRESCGNMFVRRSSFEEVGGFDENITKGEDTALSVSLRKKGGLYDFLWNTYTIPSAREASLKRTIQDSWNYVRFLATGHLEE